MVMSRKDAAEGDNMSPRFTHGQRALLESALLQRQHALDQRLDEHTDGHTRAEHARELLMQDSDDLTRRQDERDKDMARTDHDLQSIGVVSQALRRLQGDDYGVCTECGEDIPFDRLVAEPWAMRCVACQAIHESSPGSRLRSTAAFQGDAR
jgi:DnaK suppressor protein